ncbi:MAG: penicillin-binding protein 2 [Bifidobacteriaceae bacterium]|nr:penicillin-binding protein 2 [Bifidobacteriaceae bacterium]
MNLNPARPGSRQRAIRVTILAILVAFGARLVYIQAVQAEALAAEGVVSRTVHYDEPARRGDILSSDGTILATDVPRYSIEANQREVEKFVKKDDLTNVEYVGAEGAARLLAPILGVDETTLRGDLTGTSRYVPLVPDASPSLWRKVSELGVRGIFGVLYYERSYPAGSVAGNVIGYPYMDGDDGDHPSHYTGLELTQNDLLTGKPGQRDVEVGGGGEAIPGGEFTGTPAVSGCDVVMTLDSDLQWEALNAIDQQVAEVGAESGLVVAIDIPTGEILALADSGTVNPNEARRRGLGGSHAVQDIFEPGSTGKVVTMAMVLETGEATPTSTYSVPALATFGGQEFKDHDDHATANWTLNGILAQSSNIGTIMAAQNIPDQTRYDYLTKFGFGAATGVELPAENPGIVHVPGTQWWDGRTRNTVLFGQGVAVNGLQAAGVYQIVGNGGVAMSPHLIRSWRCPDGTSGTTPVGQGTRVISEETADQLVAMLESAVDDGTGGTAKITGYRVAGKTGTSEMIGRDGTADYYVSSFIGVAPADNPRVAVAVIVNDAKGVSWGATVAAPVFKKVASFALQRLDVPPSTAEPTKIPTTW